MKADTLTTAARRAPAKPARKLARAGLGALALGLALGLAPGCADKGKEQYSQAYERYQALVVQGKRPSDPAFDEVLKALEAVPKSSAASGKARALHASIQRSRQRLAPRPLANEPGSPESPDRDAAVVAKEAECVKVAEELGVAKPEAREAVLGRLQVCKRELEHLKDELFKRDEPK
ncbi:MAG TPA: hypothetical protein VK447_16465 [Myxococcaceae bacterium]|nr:hypothetical protein [Myxococcaceae bacterium]